MKLTLKLKTYCPECQMAEDITIELTNINSIIEHISNDVFVCSHCGVVGGPGIIKASVTDGDQEINLPVHRGPIDIQNQYYFAEDCESCAQFSCPCRGECSDVCPCYNENARCTCLQNADICLDHCPGYKENI